MSPIAEGIELSVSVVPRREGLTVSFVLPSGIAPARSSLPGARRLGRWVATYIAPPLDGLRFQAAFRGVDVQRLRETTVAVTDTGFPGGAGWQRLPDWLPQEHTVWTSTATWAVPAIAGPPPQPPVAPPAPLR
jgi:hypothetical protein